MLEGFQIIKLENTRSGAPRVFLQKGKLFINNTALRVINKNNYFDVGVNIKTKQICLAEAKVKSSHSIPGKCKGNKYIANKDFINMISKFVKDYDENKRFNIPIEVLDNALVLSMAEAEG